MYFTASLFRYYLV